MGKTNRALALLENLTNRIIPYLVIILLGIIIIENPFWKLIELGEYHTIIIILDYTIIFFFIIDLIFKWKKTRKLRKFLKLYWIDLLAVFPFYLILRTYSELSILLRADITETAQQVLHESELIKESKLLEETKAVQKEERLLKEAKPIARVIRAAQRFLRVLKGRLYLSHKTLKHAESKDNIKH